MNLIDGITSSIIRQENTDPKYNNPGAIMDVNYYKSTGGQFRLQQYPTLDAGVTALKKLVKVYVDRGETLETFFAKYAPAGHSTNNPNTYANNVGGWLGIPTNVKLADLLPSFSGTPSFLKGRQLTPKLQLLLKMLQPIPGKVS